MRCQDCKREIPADTYLCEYCGKAAKATTKESDWWLVLLALLVFATGTFLFFYYKTPQTPNLAKPIAGRMQDDVSKSVSGPLQ